MRNLFSSVFYSKPQSLTPIYNMPEEYSNTIMSLYWGDKIKPHLSLKVLKHSMLCNSNYLRLAIPIMFYNHWPGRTGYSAFISCYFGALKLNLINNKF